MFEVEEGPTIDQCIKERLDELRVDQHKGLEAGRVYGYVASVEKGTMHMPRPLKFKRNTDILKSAADVEEVANLAIVAQVALEECEDFDQPLTVTVECHLRSKVPLHEMTRLQRRTARSLAKRRAKRVTNIMEAHGIPKVNLVAAGVGVSDTPGLLVFLDACSREAAMKAAMMPAVAPQPVSDDPRKVKRTLPWQKRKSALAEAQAWDQRPEAHIVEPRPPSSGYGRDARVAPAKKTPSLLSKPHATPTRSFGRSPTKKGSVFSTAGRAPLRMPTSGLWTPHWPPNELGDEEDLRLERERAQRVADARADTTARARASPTRALSPKPKPPTPPLFEEDPLPLASHDPDNPSHEGLVAVATRTARRWNAAQRLRRSRNVVGLSRDQLARDVGHMAPPNPTLLPKSVRALRYVLGGRQEPRDDIPQRSPTRAETSGRRVMAQPGTTFGSGR